MTRLDRLAFVGLLLASGASAQLPTDDIQAALKRLRTSDTLRVWSYVPATRGKAVTLERFIGDTLLVTAQKGRVGQDRSARIPNGAFTRIDLGRYRPASGKRTVGRAVGGMLIGVVAGAATGALIGHSLEKKPTDDVSSDVEGLATLLVGMAGAAAGGAVGLVSGAVIGSRPYVEWVPIYRRGGG
jgi:hypothetical protein